MQGRASQCLRKHSFEVYSDKVTAHIRTCFGLLRDMKADDETVGVRGNSKSRGFRRGCTVSELIIVNTLMAKVQIADSAPCVTPSRGPCRLRSIQMSYDKCL